MITPGPSRLIGRVWGLDFAQLNKTDLKVEDVVLANVITLMPVYDFFAPLRPIPVMGENGRPVMDGPMPRMTMARDPLITGRDFTFKPYKVHVRNGPGVIFDFFSQMDAEDRKTYVNFITQARDFMKGKAATTDGPRIALPSGPEVEAVARTHGRH